VGSSNGAGKDSRGEHASRSASEPDSVSIGIRRWPVCPTRMKPSGAVGDSARGKISRGAWEALSGGSASDRRAAGIHNRARPGRESERPTVAEKFGNSDGAKGPYWKHESVRGGEIRLEEKPTTETRAAAHEDLPAAGGGTRVHSESEREAEAVGHTDGTRPGSTNGDPVDPGADL
jgi:hypothetical protein